MTVKWFCIVLLVPTLLAAEDVPPLVPVETDKSTGSNLTIDSWTPKETPHPVVENPVPPTPAVKTTPVSAPTPTTAKPVTAPPLPEMVPVKKVPVPPPASPVEISPAMNEMSGTFTSIDEDAHCIRISVEGGINPQIAYDKTTTVFSGGKTLSLDDLQPGNKVIVRYVGKDLTARQIEVISHTAHSKP